MYNLDMYYIKKYHLYLNYIFGIFRNFYTEISYSVFHRKITYFSKTGVT